MGISDIFIKRISIEQGKSKEFPYTLPIIKNTKQITFKKNVTFFVGENGTGKSTMLEAIAVAYGFNAEGGSKNFNFSTANTHSDLYKDITLIKGCRLPKTSYFLRAESFYNLATNIDDLSKLTNGENFLNNYGGKSLHDQSHGESFISLFLSRFQHNGLYLLDEPEAALSPTNQITLFRLIHDFAKNGSQFIIASHSPIILALPHSEILSFDGSRLTKVQYEETNHYLITKYFFFNRERYIDSILDD